MSTGRNDPCPCGSGKKYKKCCLQTDEAAARPPWQEWHELDKRLLDDVLDLAHQRFPKEFEEAVEDFPLNMEKPSGEEVALFYSWMSHAWKFDGRTATEYYLKERGPRLERREREWLQASIAAWTSYWEVLDVTPGTSVRLRDLFTGEERVVSDRGASATLIPHVVVLARLIDHQGITLLGACHNRPLPPSTAQNLVDEVRGELELAKQVSADRLRDGETPLDLIFYFIDEVSELDNRPAPELRTAEGHPLAFTEDKYTLTGKGAKAAIVAGLESWSYVSPRAPSESDGTFTVLSAPISDKKSSVLAQIQVKPRSLLVTALAEERADETRQRLEKAFPGIIRFDKRNVTSAESIRKSPGAHPPAPAPVLDMPDMDAVFSEFKAKHYATWPDIELPALDGLTPREASKQPNYRGRLNTLLKDMEVQEQRESPGKRYDFQILRRALGL